jgi:hypothetical protein
MLQSDTNTDNFAKHALLLLQPDQPAAALLHCCVLAASVGRAPRSPTITTFCSEFTNNSQLYVTSGPS